MCVYIIFHIEYCYHCAGSVRVSSKGQPPSFQCSRLPAKRERRSPSCPEKARPVGSVVFSACIFSPKNSSGTQGHRQYIAECIIYTVVLEYISTSYTYLVIGISLYILCYTYTLWFVYIYNYIVILNNILLHYIILYSKITLYIIYYYILWCVLLYYVLVYFYIIFIYIYILFYFIYYILIYIILYTVLVYRL